MAIVRSGLSGALLTGLPSIDLEHASLVVQLNRLIDNPAIHPATDGFSEILGRLGAQISEHFDSEESILKGCGMPADEVERHVQAHTEILEQYAQMNCDLMDGKPLDRTVAILMIKNWVLDHIAHFDSRIAAFATAKAQ